MMRITIRADGNAEIGFGHLFRTSAVAEELLRRGHQVTYATTTPRNVASVTPSSVEIIELKSRDKPRSFTQVLPDQTDVVLIDSYRAGKDYQRTIRDKVSVVLVSDDTRHPVCADVVINGNIYGTELEYEVLGNEPVWCLGADYLLLRESIASKAVEEPPWREQPERTIITMGGSDPTEMTPKILEGFDGTSLRVDAIIGPGFSERQERHIRRIAETVSADVYPIREPDDIARRIFESDFAVCTASTTTYEMLALGTPIISLPVVDNQQLIAAELLKRDAATVLQPECDVARLREAVETYIQKKDLRWNRRSLGRNLVDGKGTHRVVDCLTNRYSS
ncbi:PseG/SpsG family protein [Natronosalvus halobius]|uniref:PseG/SpsG family protein n=1 Tax=Natronosalvus halobius TaxID=2953746 RepID=UPI00209E6259|nr:hypothetical protein [Natronosalvus halobius]USZ71463.1 hypothetical protein NGM15_15545 [Natronosalvus halobius]